MSLLSSAELKAAARLGANTNLLHGWIYFAPEAAEEYRAVGLADHESYFASRAAPMGAVGAAVVHATFFNFAPHVVAGAIPSAWEHTTPDAAQAARLRGAAGLLDRVAPDVLEPGELAELNETAERICSAIGYEGRPLAGANREVELPDHPLAALWQRLTVLREWRGDAHVAVLGAAPVDGIESLVLHAGTGQVAEAALRGTRGWTDDDWGAAVDRLAGRGLVTGDGALTERGLAYREEIELRTNDVSWPLVAAVGEDAVHEFVDGLRPLRDALMTSGVFPQLR